MWKGKTRNKADLTHKCQQPTLKYNKKQKETEGGECGMDGQICGKANTEKNVNCGIWEQIYVC